MGRGVSRSAGSGGSSARGRCGSGWRHRRRRRRRNGEQAQAPQLRKRLVLSRGARHPVEGAEHPAELQVRHSTPRRRDASWLHPQARAWTLPARMGTVGEIPTIPSLHDLTTRSTYRHGLGREIRRQGSNPPPGAPRCSAPPRCSRRTQRHGVGWPQGCQSRASGHRCRRHRHPPAGSHQGPRLFWRL